MIDKLSIVMLLAAILPVVLFSQDEGARNTAKNDSTLLVYSAGEPFETISEIKDPSRLDAITSPTPKDRNTKIAAERIYENLIKEGVAVRIARVEDFDKEDWREVMAYNSVIMGTPARFWNVSWEMKRFIDLVWGRIYVHPQKAANTQFAIFATAEIEPSSNAALDNMEALINDCGGVVVRKLNLNRKQNQEEFNQAIDKFSSLLAILLR